MPHIHLDARKPAALSALPWFPLARWDSGRMGALLKRAAGPAALLCVVVHVVLTCSSFRYTATLLVLDMSPSWLLASCALLAFPSSLLFQSASPNEVAPVTAGAKQPTPSELGSALRSLVLDDAAVTVSSDAGSSLAARGAGWNVARKLWNKVVQAAKARVPQPASSSRAPSSLRRQGQTSSLLQGRASIDSQSAGSSGGSGRSLWRQRSRGGGEGSRWAPSMTRITSGQHLAVMDDTSSSVASTSIASRRAEERAPRKDHGCDMPLVPHMGHLAVDCMQHDATLPHTEEITQVITSQHLLQFGALLGESSAELALSQAGLAAAQGKEPGCLMGATDNEAHFAQGWEQVAHEVCPRRGLHYCAWRRYLRKGLFMYKSRTVFDGVTPQQLAAFHFDGDYKCEWDESCTQLMAIPPPRIAATASRNPTPPSSTSSGGATPTSGGTTAPRLQPSFSSASAGGALDMSNGARATLDWQDDNTERALEWRSESCFARSSYMYARTRFPTPMAQREYIYARRVWAKADDGGCYMLSKIAPHPAPPAAGGRVVRVQDFVSGTVIRASAIGNGSSPAAEMITVYFEDSHVSSGIMNLGVRKGLWPMVQKMEAALRKHAATAHGAALQVAVSAALQQACLPRTGGAVPLRRCQSAAGSCRGSMDGSTGTASGGPAAAAADSPALLQQALSLRLPARGPGAGAGKQTWAGAAKKAAFPLQQATTLTAMSPLKAAMQLVLAGYQRLAALLAAIVGVLLTTLRCSLLAWLADAVWQLRYRIARAKQAAAARPGGGRHVASHPVADDLLRGGSGDGGAGGPPPTRSWRRKLAARLAMVAVRAVSLPLAHRMLARSSPPYPLSRSNSVSSSYGGATMVAQHGGHAGASGTQASMSESAARVRHWLDPATAPPGYMMGQQHTELMQHHVALQQLQARRQQQQGGGRGSGSTSAGGGLSLRPSLGALVVDGVPLAWERLPAAAAPEGTRMSDNKGARNSLGAGQARGQHRGMTR